MTFLSDISDAMITITETRLQQEPKWESLFPSTTKRRWDRVDWVLFALMGVALVMLIGSLGWPLVERWQQRGRPGIQVARQFVGNAGNVDNTIPIEMNYLLYLPEDYSSKDKWPLVVFLHGAGERGNDLEKIKRSGPPRLIEEGLSFPFILVSPQCPVKRTWKPDEVLALIEHICSDWPVDRDRVYLMGFSMGGYGTWRTATAAPERFAAIVPVAGGGCSEQADCLVNLPVWAFYGSKDNATSLKASKETIKAIKAAGGNAKLTIFKNAGHGIVNRVSEDPAMWDWLLAQRRSTPNQGSR